MDLLGAALPNIMFIVGILAVGLGLGIELKVVSLNKEIDKRGRVGAFVAGLVLICVSVVMYLNPSLADRSQQAEAEVNGATAAPTLSQAAAIAAPPPTEPPAPIQAVATAAPPPTEPPQATQTPPPTQTPTVAPAAPAPAAPEPAKPPGPAEPVAPGSSVLVPDLHGKDDKAARDALTRAGLKPQKAETCTGADTVEPKPKKGRVQCQNPPAGQAVVAGATVEYVLAKK